MDLEGWALASRGTERGVRAARVERRMALWGAAEQEDSGSARQMAEIDFRPS